ncbi:hypothetical protein [Scytonema sp. NUACC26]|uniref:hypothetical protein n=1 Tax=Scytonema sp. NUACC26 TaxID=3140176 RepID=UPI0034DC077E
MELNHLNEREIATILASLRLFQKEAEKFNMAEVFPDYFIDAEITPLTPEEIDQLCEQLNT